ncbi:outer membrane protein assembly factor BamE [Sulfurimonas sp.]|uniref:outer membrane protein assembly factor BamE domain-containing protein n=1 Tax=Sulfurimonas sp. TaxID=2022749 RepID=UPI0025DE4C56|nr:outer membrane protein assembly factor BamE [Sulfurimonas sp.]MBW6488550.1 outer membrane protein assembly factor BamE [Sulfurimonas sp.]
MLKKITASSMLVATLVLSSGCAVKTGNENLGTMEKSELDTKIVKGKSTKQDIKALLGDPDRTDFDNNSLEKWTYAHTRKDLKLVSYVPVANWFVAGTNDTTKSLVIVFEENGVVKNFITSDAKGETKGGLFQ